PLDLSVPARRSPSPLSKSHSPHWNCQLLRGDRRLLSANAILPAGTVSCCAEIAVYSQQMPFSPLELSVAARTSPPPLSNRPSPRCNCQFLHGIPPLIPPTAILPAGTVSSCAEIAVSSQQKPFFPLELSVAARRSPSPLSKCHSPHWNCPFLRG